MLPKVRMDMLDIDWDKVDQTALALREQQDLGSEPLEHAEMPLARPVSASRAAFTGWLTRWSHAVQTARPS